MICPCPLSPFPRELGESLYEATIDYWRGWISRCIYKGRWREMVHRSALALKLLTFEPTGAIVAAATTSLPEAIGGNFVALMAFTNPPWKKAILALHLIEGLTRTPQLGLSFYVDPRLCFCFVCLHASRIHR
jgi:hypothetical protein